METAEQVRKARSQILRLALVLVASFVIGQVLQLRAANVNRATTLRVLGAVDSSRVELAAARLELQAARDDRKRGMDALDALIAQGRRRSLRNRAELLSLVDVVRDELRATRVTVDSARVALPKPKR